MEVPMDQMHPLDIARERIGKRYPQPKYEPTTAGVTGLFVTMAVVAVFVGLAGLDQEAVAGAVAVTAALGFCIPYFYYRHEHIEYQKRIMAEYHYLVKERDAKGA